MPHWLHIDPTHTPFRSVKENDALLLGHYPAEVQRCQSTRHSGTAVPVYTAQGYSGASLHGTEVQRCQCTRHSGTAAPVHTGGAADGEVALPS